MTSTNRTTHNGNSCVPLTHTQRHDIGYLHSHGLPCGIPNQQPTWYPWQVGLMLYYGGYATGRTNLCHCLYGILKIPQGIPSRGSIILNAFTALPDPWIKLWYHAQYYSTTTSNYKVNWFWMPMALPYLIIAYEQLTCTRWREWTPYRIWLIWWGKAKETDSVSLPHRDLQLSFD